MKTKTKMCICMSVCLLVLAIPAWAWEFNADANMEGWVRSRSLIDANDGSLQVTALDDMAEARIISSPVSVDGTVVTGVYVKMRPSQDVSAVAGEIFRFSTDQGNFTQTFELAGDPSQAEVIYLGMSSNSDWNGQQIKLLSFDFPSPVPGGYQMDVDWIRLEGLYLDNESFEYWDYENGKILGWTADAGFDFPDPTPLEHVNSLYYAAVVNGSGTAQSMTQEIKGGADMSKGEKVMLAASFQIASGAWDADSQISLTILENGANDPTVIPVDTFDAYFEATAAYTLQLDAADRTSLQAKVTVKSPTGSTVYVDDIFVGVLAEPLERNPDAKYGWPSNCVKLAEGQEITIDGIVTPEEYAGAQAIVFNADTYRAVDPYDPNFTHNPFFVTGSNEMMITPLEDYNGIYYFMWDDEAFYVAHSVQDDSFANPGNPDSPQRGDCMQFTLSAEPNAAETGQNYIPTVGMDPDGNAVAKNDFGATYGYLYDLFAPENTDPARESRVEYDGYLDKETQDWSCELKIPWVFMIGDFPGDLANGDADGDGKNVFPPVIGQEAGYTILPRDWELDETGAVTNVTGMRATNHTWCNPWQILPENPTAQTLTFVGPAE